jgi:hypothetical protein
METGKLAEGLRTCWRAISTNRFKDATLVQGGGGGAVAVEAQGAHVGEIAFAAAFRDRQDVIGIPEMTAPAPLFFKLAAGVEIELAFVFAQTFGIETALRADAVVASEDLFAQIARVGAQFPFVDADGAAKGETAARDFATAPPARTAFAPDPTTGLNAAGAHTRSS